MAPARASMAGLALGLLLAGAPAVARGQETPPENQALLALVARFLDHPTDRQLRRAVFDSASARDDITVELSSTITPWICYRDTAPEVQEMDSVLTVAFIAGNMAAQLADGRKRDQPTAGVLAVLRAYPAAQRGWLGYLVPEVDEWLRQAQAGRVGALADSLKWAPARDCPDPNPRRYGGRVKIRSVPDSGAGP